MKQIKHFFYYVGFCVHFTFNLFRNRRFLSILGLLVLFYLWGWFNANYVFYVKVGFYERYQKKEVQPSPARTDNKTSEKNTIALRPKSQEEAEKEIVLAQKNGDTLWKIYFLESTLGKNDGCRKEGKFGGFGVMDDKHKVVCYDTFQQAAERAAYWFDKLEPDEDLDSALCRWNTGTAQPQCTYSMTFRSL